MSSFSVIALGPCLLSQRSAGPYAFHEPQESVTLRPTTSLTARRREICDAIHHGGEAAPEFWEGLRTSCSVSRTVHQCMKDVCEHMAFATAECSVSQVAVRMLHVRICVNKVASLRGR